MLVAVMVGFIAGIGALFAGRLDKGRGAIIFSLLPIGLFGYFLTLAPSIAAGRPLMYSYEWIPSLHIRLDFMLDGLSLLFALLITGIGALVFIYASAYMKGHHQLDRFFCYLSIFMASMLGLVLSDNVMALFVFWELTSISSFFLIGFNHEQEAARKSALISLAITGGGGFLLMAALVLMGSIGGSYSIAEMINQRELLQGHPLYWLMLLLLFAGAFTKSAQFPFHFWLPGAMKAPTPVSAYLHSATMVKAGIYLLARFTPVLGNNPAWNNTLLITGGITMLYAGVHAIFRTDLKGVLAYATIAALGVLVFLLGIGTPAALTAAAVFILVHAFYKAALFLITGIIDDAVGTREVTAIAGLHKVMMPVAIAGVLAALSCAGLPYTLGFLGKELIYESTLHGDYLPALLTAVAVATNILLLYTGIVAGVQPFAGKLPAIFNSIQLPSPLLWIPPLLLGILGLLAGIFPAVIDYWLVQPVVAAMGVAPGSPPLKIWHGVNLVLLLSGSTLLVGGILYWRMKPATSRLILLQRFERWSPYQWVKMLAAGVQNFATWFTATFQNGYLRTYILVIIIFLVTLLSFKLFSGVNIYIKQSQLQQITIYEAVVTVIMLLAILKTLFTRSRLIAVSAMGVVGYCICLLFVFYSAPDLAMTQFTIDTLTVVLFVLVLFRLPPFLKLSNTPLVIRDGLVALSFGSLLSIIALEVLNEPVSKETSSFYAANAYLLAKGRNVVNVIIVDFRGLDTLVEITVLTIAAIGVYSMLKLKISPGDNE